MIIYLHGFRSAPASHKAQVLQAHMARRGLADAFWCEQLPFAPRAAIDLIETQLRRCRDAGRTATLVGSSLGGYYATWLAERHALKAIVVNPAVKAPLSLESWTGPQTNLYTGEIFDFTPAHVADLYRFAVERISRPQDFWLLAETGDEVLDYRDAVAHYAGAHQTVLPGGDHSFTRWEDYLDDVLAFAGLLEVRS